MKIFSLMIISLLWTFVACKATSFSGGSGQRPATKVPAKNIDQFGNVSEEFTINAGQQSALDLVWVIDNSGSMSDNIAQVRNNFESFVTSVSTRIDIKIILLSASQGSFGLTLPASAVAAGGVQINRGVGSHDGAQLAASSLVTPYFRPNVPHAYVFVTDDDSTRMSGSEFLKATALIGQTPKVFSFRGINQSFFGNCKIAAVGQQYAVMEQGSGGQAFDICLPDWAPSFSTLAETIKASGGSTTFTLKGPIGANSLHVFADGVELQPQDYQLVGLTLTSRPRAIASKSPTPLRITLPAFGHGNAI